MTGYSPIKKMYSICPVATTPESAVRNEQMIQGKFLEPNSVAWIRPENAGRVIGVQGCAWAEFINDEKHLEYMIFLVCLLLPRWHGHRKRNVNGSISSRV